MGRILGIPLRLHLSFSLLVALVLGAAAWAGSSVVGAGLWLVAVFACVVVHELAHSLVGRRFGVTVTEIELLPIGGVSKMEHLPADPRHELTMAAAGPAASFALAAGFGLVAVGLSIPVWPPRFATGSALVQLLWLNALLGGFNLLPAFPLGGGRSRGSRSKGRSGHACGSR